MPELGAHLPSRRCFGWLTALALCSCKSMSGRKRSFAKVRSDLRALLEVHNFHGTLLVTQGDGTVFAAARGHADQKTPRLLKLNDRFVIGSISKQVTAALILKAYEKRLLAFNDAMGDHLSKIQQPWSQRVTLHHLLTHTHGIQSLEQPLGFEPGTRFEYSQLGYALLAQILEQVNRKSFEQLCRELFAQLDLRSTFHPIDHERAGLLRGFERREGASKYRRTTDSLKNYAAAGSLISTVSDLARWNDLLHSGKLIGKHSVDLMSRRYATRQHPIFGEVEYGYGLLFDKGEQDLQIGALGYAPGFASASYYYPRLNMNLVVLSNRVDLSRGFAHAFRVHTEAMKIVKGYETKSI